MTSSTGHHSRGLSRVLASFIVGFVVLSGLSATSPALAETSAGSDSNLEWVGGYHEPLNFTQHYDFMMNSCDGTYNSRPYKGQNVDHYDSYIKYHPALDMNANPDSNKPVYAIADGTVLKTVNSFGGLGGAVWITHKTGKGESFTAGYGHLNRSLTDRDSNRSGVQVRRGDVIGRLATATWSHLHFSVNTGSSTSSGVFSCSDWKAGTNPPLHGFVDPNVWLAGHPSTNLSFYKNSIVKWTGDSVTSWYVGSDLKRRWIPDAATYNCLKAKGVRGPYSLASGTLSRLVDLNGTWATCGTSADVNRDGRVDIIDLSILLSDWGTTNSRSNINRAGTVDIVDLSILLSSWTKSPLAAAAASEAAVSPPTVVGSGTVTTLSGRGGDAEVIAAADNGQLYGNAASAPGGAPVAAFWPSATQLPRLIAVPGITNPVLLDANAKGLSVGAGTRATGGDAAWYRSSSGDSGELDPDGADRAFALSVDAAGRIAGYVFKDRALPVVWDSVSARPRYLPLPTGVKAGAITAMNSQGVASGSLLDDRLAIWSSGDKLATPVADAEAVDVNEAGFIVFGSASDNTSPPRVRRPSGSVHPLAGLKGYQGQLKAGLTITGKARVGGSHGRMPVVWPTGGAIARPLSLPAGASDGRVLGLTDQGNGYGWATVNGVKQAVRWTSINLSKPAASIKAEARNRNSKLYINVNPNKGSGYWTFKVQRKRASGTWKTLDRTYKTFGKGETRTLDLRKGKYRAKVKAKYGYRGATSKVVRLTR